jgi:hypothetical protein
LEVYLQESKKYPPKGSKLNVCKLVGHCKDKDCQSEECQGLVSSFNIITQEITIKTKEGVIRIPLEKFKK